MKTFTVANPTAAGGRVGRQWDQVSREVTDAYGLGEVAFTDRVGHGAELTAEAIRRGAERVVLVGGDGTINEGVNGYMEAGGGDAGAELAVYSLGTGGDLARSLGLRDTPSASLANEASSRWIDVGRVFARSEDGAETSRYFVNVASLGATGAIVERVNSGSKRFGAKFAFISGTIRGFAGYRNRTIRLRIDDSYEEDMSMALIAVANGRYFGGGMKIAPDAKVDDGEFQICVMGNVGAGAFIRHGAKLYKGTHGSLAEVRFFTGRRVAVTSLDSEPVLVESDGEIAGRADAVLEVIPGALKFRARWDRSEAV